MKLGLHQALVQCVSHALFFLTSKVIYFSKIVDVLSLGNRPASLSLTRGGKSSGSGLRTWLSDGLPCASADPPVSDSPRDQ